jgi:hypothetical protein
METESKKWFSTRISYRLGFDGEKVFHSHTVADETRLIASLYPVDRRSQYICSSEHMDIQERLRQSEQSRRLAWQVLQEIRHVLEILGDQRIPYEGERKRFRAEGDFLVRALVDLISHCRAHLGRLEN